MMVVFGHLSPVRAGGWNWTGQYAVHSFFLLSGYLMTLVLHERYGFSLTGFGRYVANRGLRIYPPYWLAALLSLVVVLLIPESPGFLHGAIKVPQSAASWFENFAIFGLHGGDAERLISPSWSLSIELIFYLAIGVGVSRFRFCTIVWVAASAAFIVHSLESNMPDFVRVAMAHGASLAFSLGALLYYLRDYRPPSWLGPLLLAFLVVHNLYAHLFWDEVLREGLYVSIALTFAIVWSLLGMESGRAGPTVSKLDKVLGDLAYPIFLSHFLVAVVIVALGLNRVVAGSTGLIIASLMPLHILAYAIHRLVEVPVEALRTRVRPS
jgi:peptidoglycan/LPS O-acetylase OafA/YrhL